MDRDETGCGRSGTCLQGAVAWDAPPLGIIFGLIVAFVAAQVWSDFDRVRVAVAGEASALRGVVLLDSNFPRDEEAHHRSSSRAVSRAVIVESSLDHRSDVPVPRRSGMSEEGKKRRTVTNPLKNSAETGHQIGFLVLGRLMLVRLCSKETNHGKGKRMHS